MAQFLDLPPEILVEILAYLHFTDLFRCRRTCCTLKETIEGSAFLKYQIQLQVSGVQDNPYCPFSITHRLESLKEREEAWLSFDWQFLTTISVPSKSSGVYDVTPSVYLLGKSSSDQDFVTTGIQSVRLPSQFPEESDTVSVEWNEFNFGLDIIDFGTAIEEHDLLACVSSVPDEDDSNICHIVVVLLRYSTKQTHDGCRNPVIPICRARNAQGSPSISIEIVGENLALAVVFNRDLATSSDFMYIFDWKTGRSKCDPFQVYNIGLVFLREDLLLNPNIVRKTLDIYYVPPSSFLSSPTSPFTVRLVQCLLLPPLRTGHHLTSISCRCDPNPTRMAVFPKYTRTSRPYVHDPASAIMILTMEIRPFTRENVRSFVMIVHRKALLDLVDGLPLTTTTMRGRQEQMSMLAWQSWGPPVTRWFNADDFSTVFITTTSGQRYVQYTPSAQADGHPPVLDTIHIFNFNPWHVRLARQSLGNPSLTLIGGDPPNTQAGGKEPEENICLANGVFAEDVVGRLPCLRCTSDEKWDYDAVLIDEERLLGMREQSEPDTYRIETIDVIYFG